jgi:hypothetical protein
VAEKRIATEMEGHMAKLDLRALSAPLEALRPDVKAAYERLDAKWDEIAKLLRKLPIPSDVSYVFDMDPECPPDCEALEFRKHKGERRICVASYSYFASSNGEGRTCRVTPFEEWSGEQRIAMLEHVPKLFEEAESAVKAFLARIPE